MGKADITVIITAYNSAKYIRESLDSVLSQTCQPKEILVVDDGSTDNTVDILKTYGDKIRILQKPNGGPASARNFGLKHAGGKYIAFLDADDIWLQTKLERQFALIEQNGSIGLVYTDQKNYLEGKEGLKIQKPNVSGNIFKHVFKENFIGPSMVLVKKECFDRLGGFDEDKNLVGVEDYDMWLRITKEYTVGCIPDELVLYRIHSGGLSKNIDRIYLHEKNVLDKAFARWPQLEKETGIAFNQRVSKLYLDYGLDYLEAGELKQARSKFLQSINYSWLNLKSWKSLLKTLLPLGLIKKGRTLKRRKQELDTLYHSSGK